MDLEKDVPALLPPQGVASTFGPSGSLASSIIAVNATFLPLMVTVVGVRLYTRKFIAHALGWDDFTCAMAAICSIAHGTISFLGTHIGLGSHLWDIRATALTPPHVRMIHSLGLLYYLAIFFIKLSICLLYLRIFLVHPVCRRCTYSIIAFCVIFYTACIGLGIAQMTKCDRASTLQAPFCAQTQKILVFQSILNIWTDLGLLMLPIAPILSLNMRLRKKIQVLIVFFTGFVAFGVSIARLVAVVRCLHSPDTLGYAAFSRLLSTVELNVAIITASIFVMPQFYTQSNIFQRSTYRAIRYRLLGRRINNSNSQYLPPYKVSPECWSSDEVNATGDIQGNGKLVETSTFECTSRLNSNSGRLSTNLAAQHDFGDRHA